MRLNDTQGTLLEEEDEKFPGAITWRVKCDYDDKVRSIGIMNLKNADQNAGLTHPDGTKVNVRTELDEKREAGDKKKKLVDGYLRKEEEE